VPCSKSDAVAWEAADRGGVPPPALLLPDDHGQMTLVSAPAGCGKTALVANWLADLPSERWAWLSLDTRDNELVRFWSNVIEALRSLTEGVGDETLQELMRSGGYRPVEQWLGLLLNELLAIDHPPEAGEINHLYGGRGVYFDDPDGHLMEAITKPYSDKPEC
jgi:hypothetical protein